MAKNPLSHNCDQSRNTSPTISFSRFTKQDGAYQWNTILRGFLERNDPKKAILGFAHMRRRGIKVDSYTLLFVIKACGLIMPGVSEGKQMHAQALKSGFGLELVTQTALLRMYCLFGDLMAARKVFDETPQRDIIQWNAFISIFSQRDHPNIALRAARAMIDENVRPDEVTVASILSACTQLKALEHGKQVHGYATKNLLGFDAFVHNALINMYAKCGYLSNAHHLFKKMSCRNVVSWTLIIDGYSDKGNPSEALALFKEMEAAGVRPDEVTVLAVVSMCTKLGSSEIGEWIDDYAEKNGFQESINIMNALIDMHSKCGDIEKACRIFDQMTERTLISWTAIIQGLAMHGYGVAALVRFSQMQREGFKPDDVVFLSVMNACSHAGLVEEGKQCFESMVEEHGITPRIEHYGSIVDLLCRAGLLDEAFQFLVRMPVKPDAVIWRTLIGSCRDQGNISLARQVMDYVLDLEPEHSGNYILKSNLHAMIGDWESVHEVRNDMGFREVTKSDPGHSYVEV
ncbi:pentatricopeptide repeat-containing protein At1g08070, chloroplastic-like [Elaeis guineensis]|uniref:Pentatricopeptide repeat-containing protein At1g08070, chloroplastic-like n=1 Tax=Elaeis guineensis var. tenera TaxID=51953 RepID=A0A6I9QXM2_ELAGV|nr:pentatricopeptide repeat-containing protein At1g08070, chloroplastic-like [Elaeis guineensis]